MHHGAGFSPAGWKKKKMFVGLYTLIWPGSVACSVRTVSSDGDATI